MRAQVCARLYPYSSKGIQELCFVVVPGGGSYSSHVYKIPVRLEYTELLDYMREKYPGSDVAIEAGLVEDFTFEISLTKKKFPNLYHYIYQK